jgi:outer membrane protein assembly factor BamD (BamD/ComL family)
MNTILGVLGESSVRALIIAVTVACVLRGMRVKSPAICHRAWAGVLLAMLCLPPLSFWIPRITIPLLPPASRPDILQSSSIAGKPDTGSKPSIPTAAAVEADASPSPKPSMPARNKSQPGLQAGTFQIIGLFYLTGFCLLIFRLLAGTLLSCRLARGASRDDRGFYSSHCSVPLTVGLFHTRILLPLESKNWDSGKLDAVLTHEKEHMRRRDPLVEWLALLNRSLYWFHPLAWWLCGKLSSLAEQACDEAVLARGHDSSVYSNHLLEFARAVKRRGVLVTAWGSSLHGSTLANRIRRILNSDLSPTISRTRLIFIAVLCAVATLVPLICDLARAQAAPSHAMIMPPPAPRALTPQIAVSENQSSQPKTSTSQFRSLIPPDNVLYETGMDFFKKRQFTKARLAFQTLLSTYSDSALAGDAYLAIADTYYEEGATENLHLAEENYRNFIVFFPNHPEAADIHMKIITMNLEGMQTEENAKVRYVGKLLRTRAEIEKFLGLFPESGYNSAAIRILDNINKELADRKLSKITGYIVDPAGNALRGVSISAVEKTLPGMPPLKTTSSDDQGYFVLPGIPLDEKIELHFDRDGLAPFICDDPDLSGNPLRITMQTVFIERIDIRGNRRVPEETIRFYIQTRTGEPYSETRLGFDVQSLYKANFFDNIEVQARDGKTGKIITFTLDEKPLIRSIQYLGSSSLTESEILEAYKINQVGLVVDSQFEYRKVRMAERILKELLAERGKPRASVRVETESWPSNNIRLRFIIDEDGK